MERRLRRKAAPRVLQPALLQTDTQQDPQNGPRPALCSPLTCSLFSPHYCAPKRLSEATSVPSGWECLTLHIKSSLVGPIPQPLAPLTLQQMGLCQALLLSHSLAHNPHGQRFICGVSDQSEF
ncbi:hypothetical protein MHYP_G00127980 [Metynnis hypsauchen]